MRCAAQLRPGYPRSSELGSAVNYLQHSADRADGLRLSGYSRRSEKKKKKKTIGACLLPAFTYKAGNLWLLEANQTKSLAQAGLDVDQSWMLAFTRKCHAREGRPCTMPGKVMLSHEFDKNSIWFMSGLLRYGRTSETDMMPAKEMVSIEDVGDGVLPVMTKEGDGRRLCAGCSQDGAGLGVQKLSFLPHVCLSCVLLC